MKIGIVTSGVEILSLFCFLTRYDHEYIVYYDSLNAPYWAKNFSTSLVNVKKWVEWLEKQWAERIIVPSVYELKLLEEWNNLILPLFRHYLLDYVFHFSLVWKIGMIWEFADIQEAQNLLESVSNEYHLSENQRSTKHFSYPFHYWVKEESILNSILSKFSCKSYLMNTLMKHEFRYFKDANVDTVVPLNYAYFNAERTIIKFFNANKTRFHWINKMEEIFANLVPEQWTYSVSVYWTNQVESLKNVKRLVWLMQRGQSEEIKWL